MNLDYPDTATFYFVTSSGYGNNKVISEQEDVPVVWVPSTGFTRINPGELTTSDAQCYPDPENDFVIEHNYRLEGMYILAPLFDVDDDAGWYKVINCNIYRDHLIDNQIDNIQLLLKKTRRVLNVS